MDVDALLTTWRQTRRCVEQVRARGDVVGRDRIGRPGRDERRRGAAHEPFARLTFAQRVTGPPADGVAVKVTDPEAGRLAAAATVAVKCAGCWR